LYKKKGMGQHSGLITQKAEIGRLRFKVSTGKKFARFHLNQYKVGHSGLHLSSSFARGINKRIMIQAQKQDPISRVPVWQGPEFKPQHG
jgi:hypothetical protein